MKNYIKLIRPGHWIKNLLIFIPVFFSLKGTTYDYINLLIGFISFSLLASSVYIINDIFDKNNDLLHPKKRKRPIASGKIDPKNALFISFILLIISISLNIFINKEILCNSLYLLIIYYVLNILYSTGLKNVPIVDIYILSSYYIIRLFYGAELGDIKISEWLLLTTLNAALFLGISKRKSEIDKKKTRKVLKHYTKDFLDKFLTICLGLTIMFYSLWVMNQNNYSLFFSIPMVLFIVMEYMLSLDTNDDPVTIFFSNKVIIISTIIYIIFMFLSLYK